MKYLFLDTNIYLHFKHFEQIDWKSLFNDDVTICVPQRVLVEIDKHKDQSRGKIQKKAKTISARLGEVLLQGLTSQVPLKDIPDPPATAFDDPQYHKEISDDWIILSALHCSINNSDIVIVAYDNGILLKAKQHGLCFFSMPDSFLIADEPSDEEKEIKQLKQQLAKYENRRPIPAVEFENRTQLLTIQKPQFIDVKKQLEEYETEIRCSHPYQSLKERSDEDFAFAMNQLLQITHSTPAQKQEYNKELDDYFKKKLSLKDCQLLSQFMEQRFVKLPFWLSNVGTSSLGNTMIFLTFPPEVALYNQKSKVTVRCEDPKEPILKTNWTPLNHNLMGIAGCTHKKDVDVVIWDVRKKLEQNEFKYQSAHLLHTLRHLLEGKDELYIDITQCGNFAIKWIVIDSELIKPVLGELHVVINDPISDSPNETETKQITPS